MDHGQLQNNSGWQTVGTKLKRSNVFGLFYSLNYKDGFIDRVKSCGDILNFIRREDSSLRRAKVKKNLIGYLRSIEVTHKEKEHT